MSHFKMKNNPSNDEDLSSQILYRYRISMLLDNVF